MNRRYQWIVLGLVLAAVASLSIIIFKSSGAPRPHNDNVPPERGHDNSKHEHVNTEPGSRGASVNSIARPDRVNKKRIVGAWAEVPFRYAVGPSRLFSSVDSDSTPVSYFWLDDRLTWEATFGANPQLIDQEKRSLAIVQAIDYLISKQAGLPSEDGGPQGGSEPEYYFALGAHTRFLRPEDPGPIRQQLLEALRSKSPDDLKDQLPEQHQFEGVEEAIACRRLSLLASLGPNDEVVSVLRTELHADAPLSRRTAAFNGLLAQGRQEECEAWLRSQPDRDVLLAIADSLAPTEWKRIETNEPGAAVKREPFYSYTASQAPPLDAVLVELETRFRSDPKVRPVLAAALAGRVESPGAREAVLGILEDGDPDSVVQVLRQRPVLGSEARYVAALRKQISSQDLRVKTWAIINYSLTSDPQAWTYVLPQLRDPGPRVALAAVSGIRNCGLDAPLEALRAVLEAKEDRKHDSQFGVRADLATMALKSAASARRER